MGKDTPDLCRVALKSYIERIIQTRPDLFHLAFYPSKKQEARMNNI